MPARFRFPWRRADTIREDVDAELRFHLDARAEALVGQGVSPEAARAQALREFGDVDDARRYMRAMDDRTEGARRRRWAWGEARQDVAYAVRTLRHAPLFALTTVVTLALGIGATVAIFSVVHAVLLRPLPCPEPQRLYRVWAANRTEHRLRATDSPVDLDDWRARRRAIADVGGWFHQENGTGVDLTAGCPPEAGGCEPRRLATVYVTPGFFAALGAPAQRGRLPRDEEMVRGGPDRVVMLTDSFWRGAFGASPGVVGTTLTLNGEAYQVLGVLPPSLSFPVERADVYIPLSTVPDASVPRSREVRMLGVVARARAGVSESAVRAELEGVVRALAEQYPADAGYDDVTVVPLRDAVVESTRTPLLVLSGAVAFVLLIACVNVASLLLARAVERSREMAVRAALGAGRGRLARQLLTESVLLSVSGGLAGLGVAHALIAGVARMNAGQLPRASEIAIDAPVLAFALGVSLLTGVAFGLVPALRLSGARLQSTLRAGGRGMAAAGDGARLRDGLVVAEVALAVVLVTGAGLMARSFVRLLDVDPGFRPEHLVAVSFSISKGRHGPDYLPYYEQVLDAVRATPGVIAAAATRDAPFRGPGETNSGFGLPDAPGRAGRDGAIGTAMFVSDGYFRTLGTPVLAGRELLRSDRRDAPAVAVVNRAFVARYFGGGPAVGRTITSDGAVRIVGVVGDIRQESMDKPAEPTVYFHTLQQRRSRVTVIARVRGEPLAMTRAIRETIWSLDKGQTITAMFTLDDALHETVARPRLLLVCLGAFGMLGLGLGALGIYGVLAYLVSRRPREIGVRIALGARPASVMGMIVGRGLALTGVGLAVGLVGALGLGRFVAGMLYGVAPYDPITLAGVVVVLFCVSALGSWLPARRAAGVDPAVTLRAD
jgi:predicted permease